MSLKIPPSLSNLYIKRKLLIQIEVISSNRMFGCMEQLEVTPTLVAQKFSSIKSKFKKIPPHIIQKLSILSKSHQLTKLWNQNRKVKKVCDLMTRDAVNRVL